MTYINIKSSLTMGLRRLRKNEMKMKNTMITTYWDVGSKFFTFHKFFLEVLQTVGFLHAVLDVRVKVRLKLQTTSNEKIKFSVLITKDTYMWPASKTVQTNGGHKSSPPAPQAVLNFEQNWKKCVLGGGGGGGGRRAKLLGCASFEWHIQLQMGQSI